MVRSWLQRPLYILGDDRHTSRHCSGEAGILMAPPGVSQKDGAIMVAFKAARASWLGGRGQEVQQVVGVCPEDPHIILKWANT